MTEIHTTTPTKEQAWEEFWDVIAPALLDAHRDGRLTEWPAAPAEPVAA